MEGPTPVSALIHAATMVTAGIFLIIRFSFVLEYSSNIKFFISVLGILTALFSSIMGCYQNDIKSIIAYSTCSQLGYMISLCGHSSYLFAFFHLFNHGFFKALLFLSAGVIIHNFNDEQDIRKMGSFFLVFPVTYVFLIFSTKCFMFQISKQNPLDLEGVGALLCLLIPCSNLENNIQFSDMKTTVF